MSNPEIALPPFAETIGVSLLGWEGNTPILSLDYAPKMSGNPGMFHGGAVAGLLELAAVAALGADPQTRQTPVKLTPLNSTVEFLRAAGENRAFASAQIVKAGRRLATVQAALWQENRSKPVATLLVNIAISPPTIDQSPLSPPGKNAKEFG